MDSSPFEDLADCYEAMIDWPKRLAHETPFYRRLFAVGRGSARARCGLRDGSPRGVVSFLGATCRGGGHQRVDAGTGPDRTSGNQSGCSGPVAGYSDPIGSTGLFDVVLCVGNSLALAPDLQTARTAVTRMLDAVPSGGAIVLHVLNLWRLADGPCQWQKCVRTELDQGPGGDLQGRPPARIRRLCRPCRFIVGRPARLAQRLRPLPGLRSHDTRTMGPRGRGRHGRGVRRLSERTLSA